MNTEHLRYLLTIADCQSINKASEQLLLKQQYLSTLVKSLEKQFGVQIFNRHCRGVTLTDDGAYLIAQIRPIVAASDRLALTCLYPSNQHHRADSDDIHFFTVSQNSSYTLSKVIHDFRLTFPEATLTISENSDADIVAAVSQIPLSLGVLSTVLPPEAIAQILPADIALFFLRCADMTALASTDNHEAQQYHAISCQELLKKDLLVYTHSDVKDSIIYRALSSYGPFNAKYIVKNSTLYFDILRSSNYYSLGEPTIAQRENLLAIPTKETLKMHAMLIVNRSCLDSFICKSLINMCLLHNNRPAI